LGDLADKELATLLAELAARRPHIAVILDCRHSGSGTRAQLQETAVRQIAIDHRLRLILENLALRQQLRAMKRTTKRPRLRARDWRET
jgi:hypothetical protein